MIIRGKFVTLRAIERADMKLLCEMFNDPEIEKNVLGWAFPLSMEQQNHWFDAHFADSQNQRFMIDLPDGRTVGVVGLTEIDWKNKTATEGIKLHGSQPRGKGIGTDSLLALFRYAFDELGLHRLNMSRLEENEGSKGVHTNCGIKDEGLLREAVFKGGRYHNVVICGITEQDYREHVARTHYWDE